MSSAEIDVTLGPTATAVAVTGGLTADVDATLGPVTTVELVGGTPGPAGPPGPQGPQGPPGSGAANYTHVQSVPVAVWTITHGLPFPPNITVVDTAGNQVEGDITYLPGEAVASFSSAFAGRAFCS